LICKKTLARHYVRHNSIMNLPFAHSKREALAGIQSSREIKSVKFIAEKEHNLYSATMNNLTTCKASSYPSVELPHRKTNLNEPPSSFLLAYFVSSGPMACIATA